MLSRFFRLLCIHSIWSAYRLGVVASMVAGRLKIIFDAGFGCQISQTSLHTSRANSGSVVLNTSGEYSYRQEVSGCLEVYCLTRRVPSVATFLISYLVILKTSFLNS